MNIEQIIRQFYKKNFSYPTRRKFWWWMTSSSDEDQAKDEALQHLWNESMAEVDMRTLKDWEYLKSKIRQSESNPKKEVGFSKYWTAAAAIALVALTALTTYLLTDTLRDKGDEFVHVSVPYGQHRQLYLEDSTFVTINAGTTLIYPRHFGKGRRSVYLIGEANFDVKSDKSRPFTVETQYINVTALGTKFNVQAYPEAYTSSAILEEGITRVEVVDEASKTSGQTYMMAPNQSLVYDRGTGAVSLTEVNAERRLSWTQGNLIFEGADFKTILQALERKYDVTIICEHIERMSGDYYVKFRSDETLTDALDILNNLSHHFTYNKDGQTIYIFPMK